MELIKTDDLALSFEEKGFHYSKDILFNYYLSLITKPFVILTGISGSGKSKIAEIFAEITGSEGEKSYELIPVKPNWRDSKGLFGYHNLIDGGYYLTPMIKLFLRAFADPKNPYYLILDEMNIAKTEHYFADYLSLIESRRVCDKENKQSLANLKKLYRYDMRISLSEAIILSAIDINRPNVPMKIETYRHNRFSELWKETFYGGNNWTAQYRSELNQGTNRLANRCFEKIADGEYQLKNISDLTETDAEIVNRLRELYSNIFAGKTIVQDSFVLHNNDKCIGINGNTCNCSECPYANDEKYLCNLLYDSEKKTYLVPPEMPIPMNLFTVGTVNVDETTHMFSPKVLDRSNVIEFNEVDFAGLYNMSAANVERLNSVVNTSLDEDYYFDSGKDFPKIEVTMPDKATVNRFSSIMPEEFNDLISIFVILKKYNLHFGYRVMNEIGSYMCNVIDNTSYVKRGSRGLDKQILQKILPKMYGTYDRIWSPLIEILGMLLKNPKSLNVSDVDALLDELKSITDNKITALEVDGTTADAFFKYPNSAIKIISMLSDLNDSGFTTFIK